MLAAAFAQADILTNDYRVDPIKIADTGLSNDTDAMSLSLYINSDGAVSTAAPSGNSVFFTAYRDRDEGGWPFHPTTKLEEYVSASSGVCTNSLSFGTVINSSDWNFSGEDIFSSDVIPDLINGGSDKQSDTRYLGFRISVGGDDYVYGWAEVYAEIETEYRLYDSKNQAVVQILRTGISTVVGETILAGQTIPEPTVMSMVGLCAVGLLIFRRRFCS